MADGSRAGQCEDPLEGVEEKLQAGATVADVGCGHGASTVLMAKAYPKSVFTGFDYHGASVEEARSRAGAAEVSSRVTFEHAAAHDINGGPYDLVATFDSLHDMGNPQAAASRIAKSLAPGGTWLIVEPFAGDTVAENLNPVGRVYYSFSSFLCVPNALSQDGDYALGAQAGEAAIRRVAEAAGFSRFRQVAATPFNLVFEATV